MSAVFDERLTSVLTGASVGQLRRWRKTDLLIPEVSSTRPPLYSLRDLIALRTIVFLRKETSLQKVRRALSNLDLYAMVEHPSEYALTPTDDGSIIARMTDGSTLDLVRFAGMQMDAQFVDIFQPFKNLQRREVVDFKHPRKLLEINAERLGGYPTLVGTRLAYDEVARAIDGDLITAENISEYYPGASAAAAWDAVSFDDQVRAA